MKNYTATASAAFLLIIGGLAITLLLTWPMQILWNICLVPAIDPINEITFWQALGINVLFSIVFGKTGLTSKKSTK